MNSVDTGWVTDEDPAELAARKVAEHRFHPPLDIVDGAARIVDPIIAGINYRRACLGAVPEGLSANRLVAGVRRQIAVHPGKTAGRIRRPAPRYRPPVGLSAPYCTAFIMSKIGRYIATTMPPTMTPSTTIITGSMRESSDETATSTSSS